MGSATPNIYKLEPPTCTDDQEGLYCEDCQDALEGTTWNTEPFASVRAEQIKKHHQGQQGSEEETAAASSSVKDTDLLNAWIKKFEMIYTGICKEEIANCKYNSLQSLVERLGVNVSVVFSKDNGSASLGQVMLENLLVITRNGAPADKFNFEKDIPAARRERFSRAL